MICDLGKLRVAIEGIDDGTWRPDPRSMKYVGPDGTTVSEVEVALFGPELRREILYERRWEKQQTERVGEAVPKTDPD